MTDSLATELSVLVLDAAMEYDSSNGDRRILSLAQEVAAEFARRHPDAPPVDVAIAEVMIWRVVDDM